MGESSLGEIMVIGIVIHYLLGSFKVFYWPICGFQKPLEGSMKQVIQKLIIELITKSKLIS